jgi:hypothetical protein
MLTPRRAVAPLRWAWTSNGCRRQAVYAVFNCCHLSAMALSESAGLAVPVMALCICSRAKMSQVPHHGTRRHPPSPGRRSGTTRDRHPHPGKLDSKARFEMHHADDIVTTNALASEVVLLQTNTQLAFIAPSFCEVCIADVYTELDPWRDS